MSAGWYRTIVRALGLACVVWLGNGSAQAGEAEIRNAIQGLYPAAHVDAVRKSAVPGLYEVQIGRDLLYSDENGNYVFVGGIIDVKQRRNLTEERKNKLAQIRFSDLPLDLAIKTVRGNGRRVFATFEDPNCPYCRMFAKDLGRLTDYTMYTFLLSALAPDSPEKARAIWCAPDRAKAWNDWMVNGIAAPAADCANPLAQVAALSQKVHITGTPTIFFVDGERFPSYMPAARFDQELNTHHAEAAATGNSN